ncbi:PucR family transcriptional regulator [Listeria costaricensis]|uniref:PucR family transcriptional regulator n=1 Tax=Listeria costaricensis TaxID=2026604 RepID=UPI000C074D85|nr:PucR family transcriptional regulator [Listeria costaricensis]
MSVKLRELLQLPSLRDAKVVAGFGGLEKQVSSISVLEHTDVEALEDGLFENDEFYGSEIVISGLINVKDNLDAQCDMIRRLHKVGEIGLILYYVGVFVPRVDTRLVQLANELDFTLIIMPENETTLRYSEVIYEVVEAIVKQEMSETHFATGLLEQISAVPVNQRNVDTMLKILTDRTRASALLTDQSGQIINAVTWPRISTLDVQKQIDLTVDEEIHQSSEIWSTRRVITQDGIPTMQLYLIKEKKPLTEEMAQQMWEVVQVFMNLWGRNYEEISTAELVKAIMNDESVKMRRLAKILGVDVARISNMWLVEAKSPVHKTDVLKLLRLEVARRFQVSLVDMYEAFIVVLLDAGGKQEDFDSLAEYFYAETQARNIEATIVQCLGMENTTDVQEAYTTVDSYLTQAKKVYPDKQLYTLQRIEFAAHCYEVISSGELAIIEHLKPLAPLLKERKANQDLLETLAVFLLDAEMNYPLTAKKLFLHANTIKYRISRINELLPYPVSKMPESYHYYRAIAIWRLLEQMEQRD